jgi:hypothetical protein
MNWIRISCGFLEDPKIQAIADACRVRLAEAAGCIVGVFARLPEHAPEGDLAQVSDATLERWAAWEGKKGAFAQAFRAVLCTGTVVTKWDEYNGRAITKAEKEADRVRAWRAEQKAKREAERAAKKAGATADGTPSDGGSDTRSRTRTDTGSQTRNRTRDVRGNVTERHVTAVRSEVEVPSETAGVCVQDLLGDPAPARRRPHTHTGLAPIATALAGRLPA